MSTVLAIDLGGTRLKAAVATGGRLGAPVVVDLAGERLLETIERTGRALLGDARADAAAMCVPGLVDEDGTLVSLPGKHDGLEGTNIARALRESFDVERTAVTNDAIAYAIGEATAGAGHGARRSCVVTVGTGVGVSAIQDGTPVTSGIYGGGILGGFIPIAAAEGPADTSGQRGTIEALCAAHRIVASCEGQYATVAEVFDAHARGEAPARAGIAAYRDDLVRALVALAHAHAPERLILGGGPMVDGNPITPGIGDEVNARLFGSYRTEVRLAALGDGAALAGLVHVLEAS